MCINTVHTSKSNIHLINRKHPLRPKSCRFVYTIIISNKKKSKNSILTV